MVALPVENHAAGDDERRDARDAGIRDNHRRAADAKLSGYASGHRVEEGFVGRCGSSLEQCDVALGRRDDECAALIVGREVRLGRSSLGTVDQGALERRKTLDAERVEQPGGDLARGSQRVWLFDGVQTAAVRLDGVEGALRVAAQGCHHGVAAQIGRYPMFHLRFHALKNSGAVSSSSSAALTKTCVE